MEPYDPFELLVLSPYAKQVGCVRSMGLLPKLNRDFFFFPSFPFFFSFLSSCSRALVLSCSALSPQALHVWEQKHIFAHLCTSLDGFTLFLQLCLMSRLPFHMIDKKKEFLGRGKRENRREGREREKNGEFQMIKKNKDRRAEKLERCK